MKQPSAQRKLVVPQAGAAPAAAGTPSIAAVAPANVAVIGAQGTLALKLAKGLLEAGNKVTAAVDFPEQAKVTLDFVRKYELVSRAQLANLKLAEKDSDLPKKARVVIVEGDVLGDRKTDQRYVEQALAKAAAADAAQVVLVTSGPATGGSFFSFGPNPSQPNKTLSRSEQLVAGSGLPYAILRVSTNENAPAEGAVKVSAGPGAVAFAVAPVSEAAAAQVLGAVLGSPAPPAGAPVVLEVAGLPVGATQDKAVVAQVAEVLEASKGKDPLVPVSAFAVSVKKDAPSAGKKEDASPLSAVLGGAPLSIGTISLRRSLSPEPDEDDKPAPKVAPKPAARAPPPPPPAKKPLARKVEEDEDEEEDDEAPANPFGNLFAGLFGASSSGTLKVSTDSKPAPVVKKAAPPPPPAKKPTPVAAPRAGTTSIRAAAPAARSSSPAPSKPNPFSSISSRRGTTSVTASPPPAPQRAAPQKPAPAPAAKTNPFSTVKRTPASAASAAREAAPKEAPSSGGGLFGWFAINPTASSSSEAPAKATPAAKAAPAKAPVPAKPAPKPAPAPAPRPSAPVPSRRAASAEPEPAPKKSGGFLAFLGFGGKPSDDDDDEEEVAARGRSAPVARKAPPPPPAPKPARQASAPAPAKQVGNPFSTVKRSAAPPPAPAKPAPAKPAPAKPAPPAKPAQGTQRTGTQSSRQSAPTPSRPTGTGTNIRGTYKPVSGFSVQPKK